MELQLPLCNPKYPRIRGKFMFADNNKAILDFKCFVPEPVQQFLELLQNQEVRAVFNLMVEKAIALSELNILKRIAKLEVHTGLDDPEDEDHPITLAEQIYQLAERIDNKTEPVQETIIEPRTTLEHKAVELATHLMEDRKSVV